MAKIAFKEYYLDKITYKENENYNQRVKILLKSVQILTLIFFFKR
ncbi:hypothetical protein [Enterococcus faecalis]|nr:hypothetical protein [Enterococcus faecalis]